jgi:hypothetical protein
VGVIYLILLGFGNAHFTSPCHRFCRLSMGVAIGNLGPAARGKALCKRLTEEGIARQDTMGVKRKVTRKLCRSVF